MFFDDLEAVFERCDVLDHPFYQRWTAGVLTRDELAGYAEQYRHAVTALASLSLAAAQAAAQPEVREQLLHHAEEEAAHIGVWDRFTDSLDGDPEASAAAETAECVAAWCGTDGSLLGQLVRMYTIESRQPAISRTKLEGLHEHYGLGTDPGATSYFEVHAVRDVVHAREQRELIAPRLPGCDREQELLDDAERVLAGNWKLLDGVERINRDREPIARALQSTQRRGQ